MDRKKLLKRLTYLIFFIFLVNLLSGKFHLYVSIWWFDMPMHFLGGLWLGLAFIWLFWFLNPSPKLIFKVMIGVLIVGVLWELFELLFDNYVAQNPFNALDTASDICFDLAGGFSAILYFLKRIMITPVNKL